MKRISLLLIILVSGFAAFAQDKHSYLANAEIKDLFWEQPAPKTELPAAWLSEPAVMLHKEITYELREVGFAKPVTEIFRQHYRIQLLNADGIKDFSELEINIPKAASDYLKKNMAQEKEVYIGARVIKGDGSGHAEIGQEHIVHIEAKQAKDKAEKLKIAVPGLEPGDVLDYFVYLKLPQPYSVRTFYTDPLEYYLSSKYPVLHQQINLELQDRSDMAFLSYNGCPEFKQVKKEKNLTIYSLIDVQREARKEERWRLDSKELPYVKFAVNYRPYKPKKEVVDYNKLAQEATGNVLNSRLIDYMNDKRRPVEFTKTGKVLRRTFSPLGEQSMIGRIEDKEVARIKKWIKKSQKKSADPVIIARNAYETYRQQTTGYRYEYDNLFSENPDFQKSFRDMYFIVRFSRALKLRKIPHELVLTYPTTSNQSIAHKPNLEEMKVFIKVGNGKETIYLSGFSALSVAGEFSPVFEGAEARIIKVPRQGWRLSAIDKFTMPEYKGTVHYVNTVINASFDEVSEAVELERNIQAAGNLKYYLQSNLVSGYNYLDHARLAELDIKVEMDLSRMQRRDLELTRAQAKERDQKKLLEWYEAEVKDEFGTQQLKVESLELQQPGIWSDAAELRLKDHLIINDYASKAGADYLIEIGKFIGEQVKLTDEELKRPRESALYFRFERQFSEEINLRVPEGYLLSGLENLNMVVDNQAGSFVVKAEMLSANLAKISVTKVYKAKGLPKEDWPAVIEFTEAANQFYKKQLLFKKADISRN